MHTNVVVIQPSSSLHQNHISITIHESLLEHHPVSTTHSEPTLKEKEHFVGKETIFYPKV